MPKRILYVNGNPMARGGIEAFMMNYYRHFDKEQLQVDFIVHGYEKGAYTDEIEKMGGRIYKLPYKSKHPIRYQKELKRILSSGEHELIHSHIDAMNGWVLKIAAQCGIPVRISHSHNTAHLTRNPIKYYLNEYARHHVADYATQLFACSDAAGKWLYGNKWGGKNTRIINNAIDLKRFTFQETKREELRKQYGLENKMVIGHVGRFSDQKNHAFLIESFYKAWCEKEDFHLVLIGIGENMEMVKEQVKELHLEDHVSFLGSIEDTSSYYNMFDIFVLPSLFEGLPVVALEAQANGLTCLFADTITKETQLIPSVTFLSITDSNIWKNEIVRVGNEMNQFYKQSERNWKREMIQKEQFYQYDIEASAKELQELYLSLIENSQKNKK